MGRPINKKYLGAGTGNQIAAKVWITGEAAAVDGYIVNQRGTKKYTVADGTATGVCVLVNADTPLEGQMIIEATDSEAAVHQVTRLKNRTVTMEGNVRSKWSFDAAVAGIVQLGAPTGDVIVGAIVISVQPADQSISVDDAYQLTVTAATDPVSVLSYVWQVSEDAVLYTAITDGVDGNLTYSNSTTNTIMVIGSQLAEDGWMFRCVISGVGQNDVISDSATISVS